MAMALHALPCGAGRDLDRDAISMHSWSAVARAEAQQQEPMVIKACGRSFLLPLGVMTVAGVQSALQAELGMPNQMFEVYNSDGDKISEDAELRRALRAGQTPLSATLSEASIHYLENRREELAQMQWKLVRDQQTQMMAKISALARQLSTVESGCQAEGKNRDKQMIELRSECFDAIEMLRDGMRADCKQLDERIAGVGHVISAERTMREAAQTRAAGDLQSLRDIVEQNQKHASEGANLCCDKMDELRAHVDKLRACREAADEQHRVRIEEAKDRSEEVASRFQQLDAYFGRAFEKAATDVHSAVESHAQTLQRARNELDARQRKSEAQLVLLEERQSSLESRMEESGSWNAGTLERLGQRSERLNQAVELARLEGGKTEQTMTSVLARLADFEQRMKTSSAELSEMVQLELQRRDGELQLMRDAAKTEHRNMISELECRLFTRLERESAAREGNTSAFIRSVHEKLRQSAVPEDASPTKTSTPPHIRGSQCDACSPLPLAPPPPSTGSQSRSSSVKRYRFDLRPNQPTSDIPPMVGNAGASQGMVVVASYPMPGAGGVITSRSSSPVRQHSPRMVRQSSPSSLGARPCSPPRTTSVCTASSSTATAVLQTQQPGLASIARSVSGAQLPVVAMAPALLPQQHCCTSAFRSVVAQTPRNAST
eukprot:TRINITY_DN3993_c0_g2_i1.p1 TRINITY_DN3993_c0_g2~~TRINITY_DN3993_c0_g2_i1.p1  ORF type:complete len:688 (-),score=174.96 TRINITY_DN3993_c0_g2_i1:210-2198(-)